jgi:hypothetical protein
MVIIYIIINRGDKGSEGVQSPGVPYVNEDNWLG